MARKSKNKGLKQFVGMIIILGVILIASFVVGNYFKQKELEKNRYNEFEFHYDKNQGVWMTQIQIGIVPYNIPFYYHPNELLDIVVEEGVENIILDNWPEEIIISIPPDSGPNMAIAGIEISKITGERYKLLKISTRSAFNEPTDDYPFADCGFANDERIIISFERSERNVIYSDDRCIILEFTSDQDAIRVADTFSYNLIQIM